MNKANLIANSFWEYFESQLSSGIPVYFNFSEMLVGEIVAGLIGLRNQEDAFNEFLDCTRSFLNIQGEKVLIKESIYEKVDGRTSVILLIALQVVAAEKMAKSEGEYTEHAYFPPLRLLIDPNLGKDKKLPFKQEEFDVLWDKFKEEVYEYTKDDQLITFDLRRTDALKNKIYPLSQALLNQEDLVNLAISYYQNPNKYRMFGDVDWRSFLIANSRKLSKRGFLCLSNEIIRGPIIEQLKSFLEKNTVEDVTQQSIKIQKNKTSFELWIREEESFFGGGFNYSLHYENEGNTQDESVGKERLLRFVQSKNYLAVYRHLGAWYGDPKKSYVDDLSCVGFIAISEDFKLYVEEGLGVKNLEYEALEIEGEGNLRFYRVVDSRVADFEVSIRNGVIQKAKAKNELLPIGGLPFDLRGHHYFSEFPPTGFSYNGKQLSDEDELECNNRILRYSEIKNLISMNIEQGFIIKFKECSINLVLRKAEKKNMNPLGFRIEKQVLSLVPKLLKTEDSYLSGFTFMNVHNLVNVTARDFVLFFVKELEHFEELSELQVKILLESISRSKQLGPTHKLFLDNYIKSKRNAPKVLFDKLEAA